MAYDLVERFSKPPKYYRFYDPGTYQFEDKALKTNTVPFLSKKPRVTGNNAPSWTHAIYNAAVPRRIHNITSLKSTVKRFPYEAFSAEDLEQLLCRCGIESQCVCNEPAQEEEVCQAKTNRRIFKGPVPTGLERRISVEDRKKCPPFYDVRVKESTEFYHGCKWSERTSKRSTQFAKPGPGPTDYCLDRTPTIEEICAEKVRALKRKTCKQLRFIEKVQILNILEGKPGPGTYSPEEPKGTNLQYLGPKAPRFAFTYSEQPGPTDYWLRRDFDPVEPPEKLCQAKLPEPSCFGVNAKRFIPLKEQGASPASYNPVYKPCQILNCSKAPFGSSTERFKVDVDDDSDEEEYDKEPERICPKPTWEFKSKTIRMKPLIKEKPRSGESRTTKKKIERSPELQYIAPFYSSEGRFQPWYNNMPVHGKHENPGPCYYNIEIPETIPAVVRGPLCRADRFPKNNNDNPGPNQYKVYNGIETILHTHNAKLSENIKNTIKFVWEPPPDPVALSPEQRELLLIKKSIALLEPDVDCRKPMIDKDKLKPKSIIKVEKASSAIETDKSVVDKPKLLRYFLYSHQIPICS